VRRQQVDAAGIATDCASARLADARETMYRQGHPPVATESVAYGLDGSPRATCRISFCAVRRRFRRLYLLPAFTGLARPYWDPDARGAIVG